MFGYLSAFWSPDTGQNHPEIHLLCFSFGRGIRSLKALETTRFHSVLPDHCFALLSLVCSVLLVPVRSPVSQFGLCAAGLE